MKSYLAVSALGKNRPDVMEELSRAILECDCRIEESRMTVLGSEFAALMMIQGNWNTLTRLEAQLRRLEHSLNVTIVAKRTEERKNQDNTLPYTVEVVSIKHTGNVYSLVNFFANRSIGIEELTTHIYNAPYTGTPMFSANLAIAVPADTYIAMLREEFMDFCDELNLDAVMEPMKG